MGYTGSWVWDVHSGMPVYWSAEMCRIHGRDMAQGLPSVDEYRALYRPEDWSSWLAAVQKCVQNRTEFVLDCQLELGEAFVTHVRIAGHPILGSADQVTEIIGSTTEIIGQRSVGFDQSPAAADPFRQMIDLMPALAWSSRSDGSAEFFNRVWLDYTGLTATEAVNWGWTAAIHPDDFDRIVPYWQSVLAAPKPAEIEARLRRHDGEYRWFLFRARPLMDESRTVTKWHGTNIDIHDRKGAEEALRESERQLHQLVEAIPALIWRGTATGDLDYVNHRHMEYLGHTVEELSGGRWIDLVHPAHRDAAVETWLASALMIEARGRCAP